MKLLILYVSIALFYCLTVNSTLTNSSTHKWNLKNSNKKRFMGSMFGGDTVYGTQNKVTNYNQNHAYVKAGMINSPNFMGKRHLNSNKKRFMGSMFGGDTVHGTQNKVTNYNQNHAFVNAGMISNPNFMGKRHLKKTQHKRFGFGASQVYGNQYKNMYTNVNNPMISNVQAGVINGSKFIGKRHLKKTQHKRFGFGASQVFGNQYKTMHTNVNNPMFSNVQAGVINSSTFMGKRKNDHL